APHRRPVRQAAAALRQLLLPLPQAVHHDDADHAVDGTDLRNVRMTYLPNDSYDSYRAVDLEARAAAASPYELVLVLMDGLLDELARARGHIEHKRYQQKGASLEKCMNILNGLNGALDEEAGGEVVQGLARLYEYCIYRLSDVSVTLSLHGLDEVVTLLGVLRECWA